MLWLVLILLALFVGLLIWLLVARLQLQIDTDTNRYELSWQGIAKAEVLPLPDDIAIQFRIFFWQKTFHPLHYSPKQKKQQKPKRTTQGKAVNARKWLRKGKHLLRSFTVKTFRLDLDTDDYVRNSYWYPIFYFLSTDKRQLSINYQGHSSLQLCIENRLYKLLLAFLR